MAGEISESTFRKLQRVGKATYSISLPKRWVLRQGLRPGDALELVEEFDGSLRLRAIEARPSQLTCRINAELCRNAEQLGRLVVSSYRVGYDLLDISCAGAPVFEILKKVDELVQKLPGFELVEESESKLLIQNVLDQSKYSLDDLMRRSQLLASAIFNNLIDFITTRRYELIPYVKSLRNKAQEIFQLLTRLTILYVKKRETGKFLKPRSAAHIYSSAILVNILSGLIDELISLGEDFSKLKKKILTSPEIHRMLGELLETALRLFDEAMNAYFSLNFEQAMHVLELPKKALSTALEEVVRLKSVKNAELLRFIIKTSIFLQDLVSKCHEVAQLTLDMFMESKSLICRPEG